MRRQKCGEIAIVRQSSDGQIAAIDDPTAEPASLPHDSAELGMELRRAAGDVEGGNLLLSQHSQAGVHDLRRHHFLPLRTGIDVTVPASLVAALADIDLKDRD